MEENPVRRIFFIVIVFAILFSFDCALFMLCAYDDPYKIPYNLFQNNVDRRQKTGLFHEPSQRGQAVGDPGSDAQGVDKIKSDFSQKQFGTGATADELKSDRNATLNSWREDADLHKVVFIDQNTGWAVGDHGTILATTNGGANWTIMPNETTTSLTNFCYVDSQNMWAAGRMIIPYTRNAGTRMLRSQDGGKTWIVDQNQLLPGVTHMQFVNRRQGWAAGDVSTIFSSSVFTTDDGGRIWTPVPQEKKQNILAATAFNPERRKAAHFDANQAATSDDLSAMLFHVASAQNISQGSNHQLDLWANVSFDLRKPRDMATNEQGISWLVGDGGLILVGDPRLGGWVRPTTLPKEAELLDENFCAVACSGNSIWIAGANCERILHSSDAGRTWKWQSMPQTLRINDLCFLDPLSGWAVGSLGTILQTTDGGKSWRVQRGMNRRAAMLILVNEPDEIPWELIAQYSLSEGYYCIVSILNRRDIELPETADHLANERAAAGLNALGAHLGSTAWQFPLRQKGIENSIDELQSLWTNTSRRDAKESLQKFIDREIDIYRPAIVLIPERRAADKSSSGADLIREILTLRQLSAPEQAKLWTYSEINAGAGALVISSQQIPPRQGQNLFDLSIGAKSLARSDKYLTSERSETQSKAYCTPVDYSLRQVRSDANEKPTINLFAEVTFSPNATIRRDQSIGTNLSAEYWEHKRRLFQKQASAQSLLIQGGSKVGILSQSLGDVTSGLTPIEAGDRLWYLANHLSLNHQESVAVEIVKHLEQHYPWHPATAMAWYRSMQSRSSAELAILRSSIDRKESDAPSAALAGSNSGGKIVDPAVKPASATAMHNIDLDFDRLKKISFILERQHPFLVSDPVVRSTMVNVWRTEALLQKSHTQMRNLALQEMTQNYSHLAKMSSAAWSTIANIEKSSGVGAEHQQRMLICTRVTEKPHLDGVFDDAIWHQASTFELHGAGPDAGLAATTARIAYDEEYLYLAVQAPWWDAQRTEIVKEKRTRDPDLSAVDRIEWFFDTDRDRSTWMRLSGDSRGMVRDDIQGDTRWNPRWFVAAKHDEQSWNLEIAIPLDQLSQSAISPGTMWAFQIQRVMPTRGVQSLSTTSSVMPLPETWNYLTFEK